MNTPSLEPRSAASCSVTSWRYQGDISGRQRCGSFALLLAHHFRLEWTGGALRICQAHARIIALLDQVRLTMLVDCYPTLDEAVLAAWVCQATSSPAHR
ncbi:MAG: hypothetical protein ABSE84_06210 [Isosphaeraceae bacterium]